MNPSNRRELIDAALKGDPAAVEQLHVLCSEASSAQVVVDLLFAAWDGHSKTVEDWLQAIVEMHPDMALTVGRRLRAKLGVALPEDS